MRLGYRIALVEIFTEVKVRKTDEDLEDSKNEKIRLYSEKEILTFFSSQVEKSNKETKRPVRQELDKVRMTNYGRFFRAQKEYCCLKKTMERLKSTEILLLIFRIHAANTSTRAWQLLKS